MNLDEAIGFKKMVQLFEKDECLPLPEELMGVEIEVEGMPSRVQPPSLWTEVDDNSLRNYGREYIFSAPTYGTGVTDALMDMSLFLEENKPSISYRCSVHVHINVSDMSVEQFLTMLTLYLIFERTFTKYHGQGREDNIFCVPYYKSPSTITPMMWVFHDSKEGCLVPNQVRDTLSSFQKYSALNLGAVLTHGSLEFRHMPGTADMGKVFDWIKIIQHLKRTALEGTIDYMELISSASGSTSTLLERVFQESAELLRYPDMTNDIISGARLAQRVVAGSVLVNTNGKDSSKRVNKSTTAKLEKIRETLRGKGKPTIEIKEVAEELERRNAGFHTHITRYSAYTGWSNISPPTAPAHALARTAGAALSGVYCREEIDNMMRDLELAQQATIEGE